MAIRQHFIFLISAVTLLGLTGLMPASSFGGDGDVTYSNISPEVPDRMCTDGKTTIITTAAT